MPPTSRNRCRSRSRTSCAIPGCPGGGLRPLARSRTRSVREPSSPGSMPTPCRPRSRETRKLLADAQRLAPEARLPLVEMAAPALCQMTPAQFHDFIRCVEALVQADQKLTLFEYALQRLLMRHVVAHFVRTKPPVVKYTTITAMLQPLTTVLSALARIRPTRRPTTRSEPLPPGSKILDLSGVPLELDPSVAVDLKAIDAALEELAKATPQLKKKILEACAACISSDGVVTVEEGELAACHFG